VQGGWIFRQKIDRMQLEGNLKKRPTRENRSRKSKKGKGKYRENH
jgi:hypothetical protein